MKRTIMLTLGISLVGVVAFMAGVANQTGGIYLIDALGKTFVQATSNLTSTEPDVACIYGGELFSENSIICYGASSSVLVCKNNNWASVVVESRTEDCDRDGSAKNYLSPLS